MNEKLNELLQDKAFIENLSNQENDTDVQKLLSEKGVELTLEEIATIKAGIEARLSNDSEELSEDDLENVAGGSSYSDVIDSFAVFFIKIGDSIDKWTRRRW